MKFAHMADCHIGSWRDPKLRDISTQAFVKAMDRCAEEKVDFVLVSGDLFNTSLPSVDRLKTVVQKFKELKDKGISIYTIAGSHDFSPSGKTMLDVLESAGLCFNVTKGRVENNRLFLNFIVDKKTGAKITGMLGKKGGLEKHYYDSLDYASIEKEEGYKIFMFHTAISELKPAEMKDMESSPLSFLPKGFDYYAGGHVHIVDNKSFDSHKNVTFPGPLFPNSFSELEKLQGGGFYIVEDGKLRFEPIVIYQSHSIRLDCKGKTPEEATQMLLDDIKRKEFIDTIVTIRLYGKLKTGRPSDINFRDIFRALYDKSAYFVMKNTYHLTSPEFEEVKVDSSSVEDIEDKMIREHSGQIQLFGLDKDRELTKKLIQALSAEKLEGERVADFEKRIEQDIDKLFSH
jgi:exonuclease SbcD